MSLYLAETVVHPTRSFRILGMFLDKNLNVRSHIKHISKRINSGIFLLRSLRDISNSDVHLAAYYELIHSHVTHAVSIWSHDTCDTVLLFKLQKRAVRTIFLCPYTSLARTFSDSHKYQRYHQYVCVCVCFGNLNYC